MLHRFSIQFVISQQAKFHLWIRVVTGVFTLLFLTLTFFLPLAAQTITPTHTQLTARVTGLFQMSPDGSQVVYRLKQDASEIVEIYSVSTGGGNAIKLNALLTADDTVADFAISPDSSWVVYSVFHTSSSSYDLFSVPILGGTTTKLTQNVPADAVVNFLAKNAPISPDSHYVVYGLQKKGTIQVYALVVASLTGGGEVTVTPTLVEGGSIALYRFSLSGSHLLYSADQEVDEHQALYAVPITGGSTLNLSGNLATGRTIDTILLTKSNDRVIYAALNSLFSASLSGGTPIQLNDPLESALSNIWLSPDGNILIYATQTSSLGVDKYKLYATTSAGGSSTKLSATEQTEGTSSSLGWVYFTKDGQQAVFSISAQHLTYLYAVPISGGAPRLLAGPIGSANSYVPTLYANWSDTLVFVSGSGTLNRLNVAQGSTEIIGDFNGTIMGINYTPDDAYIIFNDQSTLQLYIMPAAGGDFTRFNVELNQGEYVDPFDDFRAVSFNGQSCQVYAPTILLPDNRHQRSIYASCVPAVPLDLPNKVYLPLLAE